MYIKLTEDQFIEVRTALELYCIANTSTQEVVLSVGESLLLTINACEKAQVTTSIIDQLKIVYLEGIKDALDSDFVSRIGELFADKKQFKVSADPRIINADSTRRYFETHLSYYLLKSTAQGFDTDKLTVFTEQIKNNLCNALKKKSKNNVPTELILNGIMDSSLNKYQLEYAELINKLKNNNFHDLSVLACANLCAIAQSTILATLNTQHDTAMPASIYEHSIFSLGVDGRGRHLKENQGQVLTGVKGLISSTTPIPRGDIVVKGCEQERQVLAFQRAFHSDETTELTPVMIRSIDEHNVEFITQAQQVAEQLVTTPFLRSVDQAGFLMESEWCQRLFSRQTHIYANGISSTTLALLRTMLLQKRAENAFHSDYFQNYITAFAALMIYNSGGHSLFEIFEVLKLPQFNELVTDAGCDELVARDELMQQWLFKDQTEAFHYALNNTIVYQQNLLAKRIVNAQLQQYRISQEERSREKQDNLRATEITQQVSTTAVEISLHQGVLLLLADEFRTRIEHTLLIRPECFNIDALNQNRYSALMIAAQIGKLEHLKALIDNGANLAVGIEDKKKKYRCTALELAIKNEKYPIVLYLLDHHAMIKKATHIPDFMDGRSLIERAPALYFACRQHDVRILEAILCSERGLTLEDKLKALEESILFEYIPNIAKIITLLSANELNVLARGRVIKSHLLDKAVSRGNVALVEYLLSSVIAPEPAELNYGTMLEVACDKHYLPVARLILSHALIDKNLPINTILNNMMVTALNHQQFDIALLIIAYGADPEQISYKHVYLERFITYLRSTPPETFNALFTDRDRDMIASRAQDMKKIYTNRTAGLWNVFINLLVRFLNQLSFINLDSYFHKTELITRITHQVITNDEPIKGHEVVYGYTQNSPEPHKASNKPTPLFGLFDASFSRTQSSNECSRTGGMIKGST